MSADIEIEYFFDIASPYSYLASARIDDLEDQTGATVRWRPFLLGGVLKETGNSPPARVQAKAQYMLTDLNRWAQRLGIPFEMPGTFPINSLSTQRALVAARELDEVTVRELADALFEAYWSEGVDVSQPPAIEKVADERGFAAGEIVARIDEPAIKERLEDNSAEAVDRGAFGAPTFFVDDEMFWGNDRVEFVRRAVERRLE